MFRAHHKPVSPRAPDPAPSRAGTTDLGRIPLVGARPAQLGPGATPALLPAPLTRRSRVPAVLASLLIGLGALMLADAGVTLIWQEPLSALYATLKQQALQGDLRALDREKPSSSIERALSRLSEQRGRIAYLAAALESHAKLGAAVGRISIPSIGASFVVVKGTGTSELENGPGIYSETSFPGIAGTTAIAGHRTTYLAPFRHIDELRPGQPIVLEMPYARLTYRVTGSRVVLPTDVSAIRPNGHTRLILSACTPPFSASHRLLVFARLSSVVARGAARLPVTGSTQRRRTFDEEPLPRAPGTGRPRLLPPFAS